MKRVDTSASAGLVTDVARGIAARRKELGLTQEALAERLDLPTKNVQRLESGTQNVTLATLERVAKALETNAAALLEPRAVVRPSKVPVTPTPLERLEAAGFRARHASATGRRSTSAVPLTTIRAAAGAARGGARAVEALAWVTLPRKGTPPAGQFVAAAEGHSMEPRVPSGALCLFGPANAPPFGDRIFLVSHASLDEEGLDGPFALKRIESKRGRITLRSLNPQYAPLVVEAAELRIVAELLDVLAS